MADEKDTKQTPAGAANTAASANAPAQTVTKQSKPQDATKQPPSFDDAKDPKAYAKVNAESNKFKDADDAVFDATPEGAPEPQPALYEGKPPLNPVTKSYKANFPDRGEDLQNYAPVQNSTAENKK